MHSDFQTSVSALRNYTKPVIKFTSRNQPPRIVLALENSIDMNSRDQWEYIRTACKKFILHDLPENAELGLVMFNTDAYISHAVTRLGASMVSSVRNNLAFSINNKHNLSPKSGSCVRCAVDKSIEALTSRPSDAEAGIIILITRDNSGELASDVGMEATLIKDARKHNLQIYPLLLQQTDFGVGYPMLERVAHETGASSFLLSSRMSNGGTASIYLDMIDAFRVVQSATIPYSPQLVRFSFFCLAVREGKVEY